MKVAVISPWNVRCGIATYTKDLVYALANEDVENFIVRYPRFGFRSPNIVRDVAERVPSDVDLIHVQHEYGLYENLEEYLYTTLQCYKKPIITTMHAVGKYDMDDYISKSSAKLIVHNEFCRSRTPYANVVVIPHGVTSKSPNSMEPAKQAMLIEPSIKIVGYLGFISNYKGLETLIGAMSEVKNAGLLICGGWHTAGETSYIEKLKLMSVELLGKRVKWTGYIPEEKLADAYGAMDILVYPSRWVTESGALLHGIGYGKAIIASDLEPNREKEKEGALWTFKNVDDLAGSISSLLEDEQARKTMEQGARKYAEKNSWSDIAKQHVLLYESLLNQ